MCDGLVTYEMISTEENITHIPQINVDLFI